MKKIVIILSAIMSIGQLHAAGLTWSGNRDKVISVTPPATSGLDEVCVVQSLHGVTLSFATDMPSTVKWYRYSNLGGGFAEPVSDVSIADGASRLDKVEADMGYIIENGDVRYNIWVIDYSRHEFTANALNPSSERDCSNMTLDFDGNADEIVYFSINGRRIVLDREIKISYRTLERQDDEIAFREKETIETFPSITSQVMLPAPLCQTDFTLEGDRFLREWGRQIELTSPAVEPFAVSAVTSAVQANDNSDNMIGAGGGSSSLGGSAPCIVEFEAAVTDAAIFREWQFSKFSEFDVIDMRVSDLSMTHTFNEEGTTYVRFVCANAEGSCEYTGDPYVVNIGASALKCPNAFSPGNADGINDEWKVSYSSIITFECHIFDRYGRKMITLNHPSQGWDGKYKGKLVPAGAYFYVIKATGADGRKYELSGDINIVNYE